MKRIICEDCPLSTANYFPNEEALKKHEYMHHRAQKFDCSECTEKFSWKSELRKHMLRRHKSILEKSKHKSILEKSNTSIIGGQVQNKFQNTFITILRNNVESESKTTITEFTKEDIEIMRRNPSFSCMKKCEFETESTQELKKHMEDIHEYFDKNIIQCKLCGYLVYKRDHLYSHMQRHITTKEYICQCGNSYKNERSLKKHKVRNQCQFSDSKLDLTPTPNDATTNNSKGETSLICHSCGTKFSQSHHLRRHRVNEHQDFSALPSVCELCQQRFISSTTLLIHQEKTNHFWRPAGEIQTCHLVKTCEFEKFETLDDLKLHIRQKHHGLLNSSKNLCQNCGIKFNRPNRFRQHITKGECVARKNCCPAPACDFTCEIRNEIQNHINLEHDGLPYHCDTCPEKFKDWSSMRSHILLEHAVENRKVCEGCGASFFEGKYLIRHLQSNACSATTDVKKYENAEPECCDECGKIFQKSSNLRAHRENVHGIKSKDRNHSCDMCDRKFVSRSGLSRHQNMWHKNNSKDGDGQTCGHCGEKFQSPQYWRIHLQKVHGITAKTVKHNYPENRHSSKR